MPGKKYQAKKGDIQLKTKLIWAAGLIFLIVTTGTAFAGNITGSIKAQGLRKSDNILVYLTKTPDQTKPPVTEFVLDQRL